MHFRNHSSKHISREIWSELAYIMNLGSALPRALVDDIGLYPNHKMLSVKIKHEVKASPEEIMTNGSYSCGEIIIQPCIYCTFGFLTNIFLHELIHAWVDNHFRQFYVNYDSCSVADKFADKGYQILGGIILPKKVCGSYRLNFSKVRRNLSNFEKWSNEVLSIGVKPMINSEKKRVLVWVNF